MEFDSTDNSRHRMNRGNGGRRKRGWVMAIAVIVLLIVIGLVYDLFFHVHNVRLRNVLVNGENVGQIEGISAGSRTWLSREKIQRFFDHIHATGATLPATSKIYHGVAYVRAADVVSSLNKFGDQSQFVNGQLVVQLKPNQHYSFSENGDSISQREVWVNGKLAGRVLVVEHAEATYVPAGSISEILSKSEFSSSWGGQQIRLNSTGNVSPTSVKDPSQDISIAFGAGKSIYAPDYHWQNTTYVPTFSLAAALQQLGWTASEAQWKWTLSKQSGQDGSTSKSTVGAKRSGKPVVLGFVPFYSGNLASFDDVMNHPSAYNALAADTWSVDSSGGLIGSAPSGTASQASSAGDAVYAMVTNTGSKGFNAQEMTAVLTDSSKSSHLRSEIVRLVSSEGYDGAMLDFESIPPVDRTSYTDFVTALASDLHAVGKRLEVVVPPDTGSSNEPWNDAYDQAKIEQVADAVIIMAYDYSYPGGKAGPIAPVPWVQQALAYTVSRMPSNKILLGVDVYGYDWVGRHTRALGLPDVDSFLATHHIRPKWDAKAEAPWYTWTDSSGAKHTVYYENAKSTEAKLALAKTYGIAGVAVWRAGLENDAVLRTFSAYAKGH